MKDWQKQPYLFQEAAPYRTNQHTQICTVKHVGNKEKNYGVHVYLHRRSGEKGRLSGMMEKRGIVESGIQDFGRGQTIAVTDGHEASKMSGYYSGGQHIIWYSGHKPIGHQASRRSTS